MTSESSSAENDQPARSARVGLSGKLLLLTILFVMIAEVLIYVPSIANFRLSWLSDRLAVARTVALVLYATPEDRRLPDELIQRVLSNLGAKTVARKMGNQRRLLDVNDKPQAIHHEIDLRDPSLIGAVWDALDTLLFCSDNEILRVVGPA